MNEDEKTDLGDAFGWAFFHINSADKSIVLDGQAIENYGVGIITGLTTLVPEPGGLLLAAAALLAGSPVTLRRFFGRRSTLHA